jgi:(p)ppGpp synthase/HD superfamily hydrolase
MENKETFQARVAPHFAPSEQLDIKLAYCLGKFGHRAQTRHELNEDGTPTRYFEHVRRVAIILMDEMQIMDRDMIIAALLHDSLEDTKDLTPELLEHCFGTHVVHIVKLLSKVPKAGYIDRLAACYEWEVLAIKACDRLDNLRSLMIPENTYEFKQKQIKETIMYYCPVFDNLVRLAPKHHHKNVLKVVRNIKRLVKNYREQLKAEREAEEHLKCSSCRGSGYGSWQNEESFTLCESCQGSGKNKELTT